MTRIGGLLYGVMCYALFLASFLYAVVFIAGLWAPRTIDRGLPAPPAAAVIIDLALLGVFAVQHSGMARRGFKRWLTRWAPVSIAQHLCAAVSAALILIFWQWRRGDHRLHPVGAAPGGARPDRGPRRRILGLPRACAVTAALATAASALVASSTTTTYRRQAMSAEVAARQTRLQQRYREAPEEALIIERARTTDGILHEPFHGHVVIGDGDPCGVSRGSNSGSMLRSEAITTCPIRGIWRSSQGL